MTVTQKTADKGLGHLHYNCGDARRRRSRGNEKRGLQSDKKGKEGVLVDWKERLSSEKSNVALV